MKKADVEIGGVYQVKVTGKLAPVRITGESRYGGWDGTNLRTNRSVRVKSASKLRKRLDEPGNEKAGGQDAGQAAPDTDGNDAAESVEPSVEASEQDATGGDTGGQEGEAVEGKCPKCRRTVRIPASERKARCRCGQALARLNGGLARIKEHPVGCVDMGDAEIVAEADPEDLPPSARRRRKKRRADGKLSGLDAAAKVLAEANEPLKATAIVERMLGQGLWETSGKTPAATIYAAMTREIKQKGGESRFEKVGRGTFALAE